MKDFSGQRPVRLSNTVPPTGVVPLSSKRITCRIVHEYIDGACRADGIDWWVCFCPHLETLRGDGNYHARLFDAAFFPLSILRCPKVRITPSRRQSRVILCRPQRLRGIACRTGRGRWTTAIKQNAMVRLVYTIVTSTVVLWCGGRNGGLRVKCQV